ncbi:MAG: DMT family transporter, partial [Candidatus Liptonbacteria bacterium]
NSNMQIIGIAWALTALFGWGFGDFMIQRATRKIGDVHALFYIGITGGIVLLPFIWQELPGLLVPNRGLLLLLITSAITITAALFDFEALKEGKISIINPIIGLELPLTVALGVFVLGEHVSGPSATLMLLVFLGIAMASFSGKLKHVFRTNYLEKGVWLAFISALTMALLNFSVGLASNETSAILTIWFSFLFSGIFCLIIMVINGSVREILHDLKQNPKLIIAQSSLDTLGWVAFAQATTYIPISITITISEAYVALSAFLGLWIGREKITTHQKVGVALAMAGVIVLSALTSG